MDIGIFKKVAESARKINWDKTANFDGIEVQVLDVDLKGNVSLNAPLTASVHFKVPGGSNQVITGVFWPKDLRPEQVKLNNIEMPHGKLSLSGKYSFPLSVKLKLRFRYDGHEFLVTGKTKGINLL